MVVGALLMLGGFTVFTGVLVAIGAVMPTAKDAGTIFGRLMALIFVPFYAISLIISDPRAPLERVENPRILPSRRLFSVAIYRYSWLLCTSS